MDELDFGQQLRDLRHAGGETLEQVSQATGVSVAMLSRLERGERLPSPETVEALAEHFGLPVDDLMSQSIAHRMLNRYGRESSNQAAERMISDSRGMLASRLESPAPTTRARRAYSERPVEALFEETRPRLRASMPMPEPSDESEHLSEVTRVAEVALESAMRAIKRAQASGDPELMREAQRAAEKLQRIAGE